jgi:hypothetical protein
LQISDNNQIGAVGRGGFTYCTGPLIVPQNASVIWVTHERCMNQLQYQFVTNFKYMTFPLEIALNTPPFARQAALCFSPPPSLCLPSELRSDALHLALYSSARRHPLVFPARSGSPHRHPSALVGRDPPPDRPAALTLPDKLPAQLSRFVLICLTVLTT